MPRTSIGAKKVEPIRDIEKIQKIKEYLHNQSLRNSFLFYLGIIGTTTLRKTFGYHYYLKTNDLGLLQQIFGHSSITITKKFIGVSDDISEQTLVDLSL